MSQSRSPSVLGFLTVLSADDQGLVGGYLILNPGGRPLEFHCTAPVKPNRAQQILFGPTLEPFLYGEQIGQTLVMKSALEPLAIYTDVEPVLALRDFVKVPVALVVNPRAAVAAERPADPIATPPDRAAATWRVDDAHAGVRLAMFPLGNNRLAVAEHHRKDQDEIQQRSAAQPELDLSEPFERIREAILEAHKQSRG
jgi:hypothetical protein